MMDMTHQMELEFQSMTFQIRQAFCCAAQNGDYAHNAPHVVYKPALSKDGNSWCALLGDNLQSGVSGFGDTPMQALWAFDIAMNRNSGDADYANRAAREVTT